MTVKNFAEGTASIDGVNVEPGEECTVPEGLNSTHHISMTLVGTVVINNKDGDRKITSSGRLKAKEIRQRDIDGRKVIELYQLKMSDAM